MLDAIERAYAVGDHRTLRVLARARIQRGAATEAEAQELARARELLAFTAPDPFLAVVGALGLGLMAFLVYNYVL